MARRSSRWLAAIGLAAFVTGTAAHAEDREAEDRELKAGLAKAATDMGITIVRSVVQSVPEARWMAPPEVGAGKAAIEAVVNEHGMRKRQIQGNLTLLEGTTNAAADAAAVIAVFASGGTWTIPALAVRAGVQAATDDYFGGARDEANDGLRAFLARNQNKLLRDTGLSYDQLRALPPEDIRRRLEDGERTFNALDSRVSDPQLREMARDLLVASIAETQKATLDRLAQQGAAIGDLNANVKTLKGAHDRLAAFTERTLDRQQASIDALDASVRRHDRAIAAVDARLTVQERNMDIVQDFMFNKMSPGEKASALKSGFLAGRFACAPGESDCEQSKLKNALIEKYESEAALRKSVETAGAIVQDANYVLQIATDLGIKVPEVAAAIQYGTVAFNAFAAASTGNYLGAVASITGAFAKRGPDPQMKYLAQQFAVINRKLDLIIKNQQILSEQITNLSKRLDLHMDRIHERFDNLDFKLAQVRKLQAIAVNREWEDCQALYRATTDPVKHATYGFDHGSSTFPTIELASAFGQAHRVEFDGCSATVKRTLGSFAAASWFGNFLMSSTEVTGDDDVLKKVFDNRDDTWAVLQPYLAAKGVERWQAFQAFASPAATIDQVRARPGTLPAGQPCDLASGPLAKDRLRLILCESSPASPADASRTAEAILKVPMIGKHAIDVAGWALLEQALVDVQAVRSSGGPVTTPEFLAKPLPAGGAVGEQHVERAMVTLDAAMANAVLPVGDMTTDAVVQLLASAKQTDETLERERLKRVEAARRMLLAQPALARNVTMAMLRDRYGIYNDGIRTGARPLEAAYATALKMAQQSRAPNPFAGLQTLFGPGIEFRRSADGRALAVLMAATDKLDQVSAPLPEPLTLKEGRLIYPGIVEQLATAREHVGVRLLDFRALRGVGERDRVTFVTSLARAEASK